MCWQVEDAGYELVGNAQTQAWSAAVFARRPGVSGTT